MTQLMLFPVTGEKMGKHKSFEWPHTFGGGRQDTIITSGSEVYTHFVTDILTLGQANI